MIIGIMGLAGLYLAYLPKITAWIAGQGLAPLSIALIALAAIAVILIKAGSIAAWLRQDFQRKILTLALVLAMLPLVVAIVVAGAKSVGAAFSSATPSATAPATTAPTSTTTATSTTPTPTTPVSTTGAMPIDLSTLSPRKAAALRRYVEAMGGFDPNDPFVRQLLGIVDVNRVVHDVNVKFDATDPLLDALRALGGD